MQNAQHILNKLTPLKMSILPRLSAVFIFCSASYSNSALWASTSDICFSQAKTPMEKALCEVKAVSDNPTLPSIEEFKKNTPKIQHLLLKREARRYGIVLPKPKETAPKKDAGPTSKKHIPKKVQASLKGCELNKNTINCNKSQYELEKNKKNNQLRASVFSSHNELLLPEKHDTEYKNDSDYRYLSHIYPTYIYSMLDLGLGDSTMSFTKFATVYWQSKSEDLKFTERFRFMYNQLKLEKSRNAVNARYRDNFPSDIHQCMRLDTKIIVCDDMTQNWIYKLR